MLQSKRNEMDYHKRIQELEEINSKNFDPKMAFNYDFVRNIHSFLKFSGNQLDFKLIGETLDAATRIYASKVEIVQKQTKKISTRLAFTDEKALKEEQKKQQRKKRIQHVEGYCGKNLVKNPSSINGKIQKCLTIDPLYSNLSSAYDVANVSTLMSRQLFCEPNGAFAFNSKEKAPFSHSNYDNCFSSQIQSFPFPLLTDSDIHCVHPAMRDFDFNDRSVDMENIVDSYKYRLSETIKDDSQKDFDDSFLIATQVYEYDQNDQNNVSQLRETSVIMNESFNTQTIIERLSREHIEEFDNYADLNMDEEEDNVSLKEIFQDLSKKNKRNSISEQGNSRTNSKTQVSHKGSRLVDQAVFMSEIFNKKNFFQKSFLKKIHSRKFPNDRPKYLFNEEERQRQLEALAIKKAVRRNKPIYEPLTLSFATDKLPSILGRREILSLTTLKNNINKVNAFRLQRKYGFSKPDLYASFFSPTVLFKNSRSVQENNTFEISSNQNNNVSRESIVNDTFSNDDFFDDPIESHSHDKDESRTTLDSIIDRSGEFPNTQTILDSFDSNFPVRKKPRYVTDFGEDMDPFGLKEQNRELFPRLPNINEPMPIEDRFLEYSTKMKKINIKKLKKIMFSIVEKFSWKHSKFEDYRREHGKGSKPECLSFYRFIYYIIYYGDLDERTLNDLTVPIFFVATLHLCNDRKLLLTKFDDKSGNFYITMLD